MSLARTIATVGGLGFVRPGSGTWASTGALVLCPALQFAGGPRAFAIAALVVFVLGLWASGSYARDRGVKDPSEVVIDEVVGLWLVFALCPLTLLSAVLGFALFRLFDIAKPWPISWVNHGVPGGLGIMLDDVLAGLAAAACLFALARFGLPALFL